jgi:peroxiredoxin
MIDRILTFKYGLLMFTIGLVTLLSLGLAGEIEKVENFTLKDYKGNSHSLSDYKDSEAIVVMFIATRCPVSNAYNSRMVDIYNDYTEKGLTFLGINSNKQEDIDEVAEHSKDNKFAFPVLKDDNNIIADKFDAQVTPEIYVLNPLLKVLYHGRIDDSQRERNVKSRDLRVALDEILAGKSVSTTTTKAFGCTIKRVK